MPRVNAEQERERKDIVFRAVQANPGLKESELVTHTNLERRTLHNYLTELEYRGKIKKERQRWFVSDVFVERKLRPIELEAEQAMSLYIAARTLARVQDERNETAESALLALSKSLVGDFNVGLDIHKAAADLAQRPERTGYNKVYRELMRACVYRKKVRITYETAKGYTFETDFEPYLFEPSLFGLSIYAVGYSDIAQAYRAYKLERIKHAELLRTDFDPRNDAPTLQTLKSAWSIMFGDETETVELEFSPSVRRRVLETNWHLSQHVDDDDPNLNAPLNWKIEVADATDMLSWVRGWGADVKVLRPAWMRNDVINHVRAQGNLYGISAANKTASAIYTLWAKASGEGNLHLLIYHMIDVGQCAMALWTQVLSDSLKRQIANWLNLDLDNAGRLIAFWASLHDLGKASPVFQDHKRMNAALKRVVLEELKSAGFAFTPQQDFVRHELISTWALQPGTENLLVDMCGMPADFARLIAQMLGGHHGAFPTPTSLDPTNLGLDQHGIGAWSQARRELVGVMQQIFEPPHFQAPALNPAANNTSLMLLAAIVSTADWLGSDEANFPYERDVLPLPAYARHAQKHAEAAILRVNWERALDMPAFRFEKVFPFQASDSQKEIIASLSSVSLPAMAIIEAPMGAGKTEAALSVYADWAKRKGYSGLYVAMPTTATSNQMHARVNDFLARQMGKGVDALLVHSQAQLRRPNAIAGADNEKDVVEDEVGDAAGAQSWFLPKKRSLLASYGVGTVDQALMSVLQTKHFFVRLLGLSHKVVIFDEIHAYDTYMSELFKQLLIWLRAVEASVIVLSATLPNATRQAMLSVYAGENVTLPEQPYPRLTFVGTEGKLDSIALTPPAPRTLYYEWIGAIADAIIEQLRQSLMDDGCAAVICNTVTRAQEMYQAIAQSDLLSDEDKVENLILFHARFPMAWREEIEQKVLQKFGPYPTDKQQKNPSRPRRAIVVATQVIEQSLDLDFDVMISDHAPVDLLLQRAGRLHRHKANNPRPHPDQLFIAAPEVEAGLPVFSPADKWVYSVYDEYILLRSWLALRQRSPQEIELPHDLPALIEQVYGDGLLEIDDVTRNRLITTRAKMTKESFEDVQKARKRRIAKPDYDSLLTEMNEKLEEDNPAVNEILQALTRSDRPGLNVICLHRMNGKLFFDPEPDAQLYDPAGKPSRLLVNELLRRGLSLRRPPVEEAVIDEYTDPDAKALLRRWKRIAALKYHHVVIFEDGVCQVGQSTPYQLELNKKDKLGLCISKETA